MFFFDLQVTINFHFVSTVPGGAAAALEPTALHVPLLSFRPDIECQRECLYTHSHRGGSAPGYPSTSEVGTHGTDAGTVFRSFGPNQLITLNKNPTDATVCRHLFTAKLLYMFRVSQHPSSGVS